MISAPWMSGDTMTPTSLWQRRWPMKGKGNHTCGIDTHAQSAIGLMAMSIQNTQQDEPFAFGAALHRAPGLNNWRCLVVD